MEMTECLYHIQVTREDMAIRDCHVSLSLRGIQ